jgi:hypothetical protein
MRKALFVLFGCLISSAAWAETQFTAVNVSGVSDGKASNIGFEILIQPEPNSQNQIEIEGKAFLAMQDQAVPVTIRTPNLEIETTENNFVVAVQNGNQSFFTRFEYQEKIESGLLTRINLLGNAQDGSPVSISIVDDPAPWIIYAIIIATPIATCAIHTVSNWIKECPAGYDIHVEGNLAGLSCTFRCK